MTTPKLNIISETPEYVVVEKPAGLLVHEAPNSDEKTLLDLLLKKYPAMKKIGEKDRPALVHRLDKEVSGLLVVPRTQEMFEHLKQQFQERTMEKHYLALVHGTVGKDEGVINFPIARSERHARMAARPNGDDAGREAITEFTTLERRIGSSLLDVCIKTGRTHQIRAHMFAYSHPVVGDPLYHRKGTKLKKDPGRIFLHAARLAFTDLAGNRVEFESPLPAELKTFLEALPKK